MNVNENGGQRWVGEVNASLKQIVIELQGIRAWQSEHSKHDTEMFAKLEAHLSWAERVEADVNRRLEKIDDERVEQWAAINELRRLVYRGVGIGIAGAALVTWALDKLFP